MEEKRRYIENIIAKNSNNEMEEAALRSFAITEEIGHPTPQNDLPNLKKNRIDFELVNRTVQEQSINLFELPVGINPAQDLQYGDLFTTKYSEVLFPQGELSIGQIWTIDWFDGAGVYNNQATLVVNGGITDLVAQLISITGDNFSYSIVGTNYLIYKIPIDTWVYWNPPPVIPPAVPPSGSLPQSFYTENQFIQLRTTLTANTFIFTNTDVQGGSGISVQEISGNQSYAEITQGLRNNITPYVFDTITIYANGIAQANMPITKIIRGQAGNTRKEINTPTILYQNKYVVTEQISLPTKTLNALEYKLLPKETVRVIITYTQGNLNAIADIINEYISDGIPFNVALTQLVQKVSAVEKKYLEASLKKIWKRKQKELANEGVNIEIENIFAPQEVINAKKQKALGEKMKLVKNHIETEKLKDMKLGSVSANNIKRLVANYAAKGDADKMFDPYSYAEGEE
jgi:hypothetical protein